jgi:hypothetical protein
MRRIATPKLERVYGPIQVGQAFSASALSEVLPCPRQTTHKNSTAVELFGSIDSMRLIQEKVSTIRASSDGMSLTSSVTDA